MNTIRSRRTAVTMPARSTISRNPAASLGSLLLSDKES